MEVCLLVVLQPVSGVVSEKWVLVSIALQLFRCNLRILLSYQEEGIWDDDCHVFTVTLHINS